MTSGAGSFTRASLRRTCLVILLLLGTGVPLALNASSGRHTRLFESSPCPEGLPAGISVECGFLVVPENRRDNAEGSLSPSNTTIRIAVAIARASSGVALPDPIVFIQGGPSAAAIDPGTIFVLNSLFGANRDVVFVDARGTGLSQPRLACPEFDTLAVAAFPNAPTRAAYLASVRQCRDRLRADSVDLDSYDSAANAENLDELRVALGYDRWNLLGLSNGGLATLTLMRLRPEGIRSVVLDSPSSNDDLWIVDRWRTANRLLEKVFADCAADSACEGQFPNLRSVFYGLIDALRQNPVDVSVPNPAGGAALTVHVAGDVFLAGTARLIQNPNVRPSLPATVFLAAHGGLAAVVRATGGTPTSLSDVFAFGKTLSTLCSDIIPFRDTPRSNRGRPCNSRVRHPNSEPRCTGANQPAGVLGLGRAASPGGSAPAASQPHPNVDPDGRVRRRGFARRRRTHRPLCCGARCSIRCPAPVTWSSPEPAPAGSPPDSSTTRSRCRTPVAEAAPGDSSQESLDFGPDGTAGDASRTKR